MEFQININKAYLQEFLRVVNSLKNKGVVSSYEEKNKFVTPGPPLPVEEVLEMLLESDKQIDEGEFFTMEEIFQKNRDLKV